MITEYNICVLKSNLGPPTLRPGLVITPQRKRIQIVFNGTGARGKNKGAVPCFAPEIQGKFASARVEHPLLTLNEYYFNERGARGAIAYGGVLRAVRAECQ